jgi:hypothetical protein
MIRWLAAVVALMAFAFAAPAAAGPREALAKAYSALGAAARALA